MAIAPRLDDTDPAIPALRLEAFPSSAQTLLVLTRDPELLATLRNVPAGHEVISVGSEADFAGQLMRSQGGVALVDAAAAVTPITSLADKLKAQFPDLVLVVAGGTEDQGALTPQITRGTVYRFLHKPLSEQRVKLFVAAAWRRHGEEHSGIFAPARTQSTRTLPAAASVAPKRKPWALIAAVIIAIAAVVFWFLSQPPAPRVTASKSVAPPMASPEPTSTEVPEQPLDSGNAGLIARAPVATVPAPVAEPSVTAPPTQTASAERPAAKLSPPAPQKPAAPQNAGGAMTVPEPSAAERQPAASPRLSSSPLESAPSALAARIMSEARNALSEGKLDEAERLIQIAAEAGVDEEDLDDLVRKAREQRISARGATMTRLSQSFSERLSQGKLIEPENDSAKHYLAQMAATDADHPATHSAKNALNARLVQEARRAATGGDAAGANRWLAEARAGGADEKIVASAENDIASERAAAAVRGPELVPASSLNKLRHVDPRYPQAARSRELAGWVDVELTVQADGSVTDVAVVRAEPAEVFDEAAIDAVRQWRYEPVVRNGKAVEQRTRVRIRFQMQ